MRVFPLDSLLMWQLELPEYSTAGQNVPLPELARSIEGSASFSRENS